MSRLSHRQTLLFLGAVIVPSVVLVGLGIRTIGQEKELAEKRAFEEKRRAVALAGQELLTKLESIKARAAGGRVSPTDRDVAIVARVESGQLILPWEDSHAQPAPAAEQAQADLLRSATLQKQGNRDAAHAIDRRLLRMNLRVTDEYGVPFALYAAKRLIGGAPAEERREIAACIAQALETSWLSPPAAYLIVELLESLGGNPGLRDIAVARAVELEQAGELAAEIPRFAPNGADSLWVLFGKSPWLVGIAGLPADQGRLLVAVRASTLLDSINLPERYRGRSYFPERRLGTLGPVRGGKGCSHQESVNTWRPVVGNRSYQGRTGIASGLPTNSLGTPASERWLRCVRLQRATLRTKLCDTECPAASSAVSVYSVSLRGATCRQWLIAGQTSSTGGWIRTFLAPLTP